MATETIDLDSWFLDQQIRIRQRLDRQYDRVHRADLKRQEECVDMECRVYGTRVLGNEKHGKRPLETDIDDHLANCR